MDNPIIRREFEGILRTRKAFAALLAVALGFALLVIVRWPSDPLAGRDGLTGQQVFRAFAYASLAAILLMVPAFPATSIVRERASGTLALLLNSPMKSWSIYFGKFGGVLGFVLLLMLITLPAATACYAMGGITMGQHLLPLYGVLLLCAVQYTAVALLVGTFAGSNDSALRITYGLVFGMAVATIFPHRLLQGQAGSLPELAWWLQTVSPIPVVMRLMNQAAVGAEGLITQTGKLNTFAAVTIASSLVMIVWAILRLNFRIYDRPRSQGVVADDLSEGMQWLRRLVFLVDPNRRSSGIGFLSNPVMVKEFRTRRFGRSHWLLRLVALCAMVSLGLACATMTGLMDWTVETIGGFMVVLQVTLVILVCPSIAAGLISSERESGGWELLQMTPLSSLSIILGKLLSVAWTLVLLLAATLPGYIVMIYVKPEMWLQVYQVIICLLLTALLAVLLSAVVSSFFRRTAPATATSYGALLALIVGTLLVWLGRDAPFGHTTVQTALTFNPMAAALSIMEYSGFEQYSLVPLSWWITSAACGVLLLVLAWQCHRLTRPQ